MPAIEHFIIVRNYIGALYTCLFIGVCYLFWCKIYISLDNFCVWCPITLRCVSAMVCHFQRLCWTSMKFVPLLCTCMYQGSGNIDVLVWFSCLCFSCHFESIGIVLLKVYDRCCAMLIVLWSVFVYLPWILNVNTYFMTSCSGSPFSSSYYDGSCISRN